MVAITFEVLLGSQEFIDNLVMYDTSLAYRLYQEVKNFNFDGSLDNVEYMFMKALYGAKTNKELTEKDVTIRDTNNPNYYTYDNLTSLDDIEVKDYNLSSYSQIEKNNISNIFNKALENAKNSGAKIYTDKSFCIRNKIDNNVIFANSGMVKHGQTGSNNQYTITAMENVYDLLENAIPINKSYEFDNKGKRKDFINYFNAFSNGNNEYIVRINVKDGTINEVASVVYSTSAKQTQNQNKRSTLRGSTANNDRLLLGTSYDLSVQELLNKINSFGVYNFNLPEDVQIKINGSLYSGDGKHFTKFSKGNILSISNEYDINPNPKTMYEVDDVINDFENKFVNPSDRSINAYRYLSEAEGNIDSIEKERIIRHISAWAKGFNNLDDFKDYKNQINNLTTIDEINNEKASIQNDVANAFNSGDPTIYRNAQLLASSKERMLSEIENKVKAKDMSTFDNSLLEDKPLTNNQILKLNKLDSIQYNYNGNGEIHIYATNSSGDILDTGNYTKEQLAEKFGTEVANNIISNMDTVKKTFNYQANTNESIYDDKKFVDKVVKEAEKTFGVTDNCEEVGYIDLNGKMLDFSGKKDGGMQGHRAMDHREFYSSEDVDWDDFVKMGNIRVFPESGGFEIEKMPNAKQQKALLYFLSNNSMARTDGSFIGISKSIGNNHIGRYDVASLVFENGESANEILNQVMSYFSDDNVRFSKGNNPFSNNNLSRTDNEAQKYFEQKAQQDLDAYIQGDNEALQRLIDNASIENLTDEQLSELEKSAFERKTKEDVAESQTRVLSEVDTTKPLRKQKSAYEWFMKHIVDKDYVLRKFKSDKLNAAYDSCLQSNNLANYMT